jgi:hypothetical protein
MLPTPPVPLMQHPARNAFRAESIEARARHHLTKVLVMTFPLR